MKKNCTISIIAALALLLSLPLGADPVTIHLMGDSTMADKDIKGGTNPERGWGMMFPSFVDSTLRVRNYAQNGRSTKSFIDGGLWDKVIEAVVPGDYVFIQFGHNDSKESDPARYAAPFGAYQDNLRTFIDGVREKGGNPVLLTPVARRWFKEGRLDRNCHTLYPEAMKAVASEKGVPLLDITTRTLDWLEGIGDEASKRYFMISTGKDDNTHTVACGARKVTEIICGEIGNTLPEIGEHLMHYDIIVDKGGFGDCFTLTEAVAMVPDYCFSRRTSILVNPGTYRECLTIPRSKMNLLIHGRDASLCRVSWDKAAEGTWPGTDIKIGTTGTATMYVDASNVTLENLTIENTAGAGEGVGQAVALMTVGDCIFLRNCRIVANQDTIYTYGKYTDEGTHARVYFLGCYIEGTTDFIFGPSRAYFEDCTLHSKKNSYITAASTPEGEPYGYVLYRCTLTADPSVDKVHLGRPWRDYARTVYVECEMGAHIVPAGWHDWGKPARRKTAYYAEYGSTGPGAATSRQRVSWAHVLTSPKDAAKYSFPVVMGGWDPHDNVKK